MPDSSDTAAALAAEQRHLSYVRHCLEAMRRSTEAYKAVGVDRLATQALQENRSRRLAALDIPASAALFFGRIDRQAGDPEGGPQSCHIGRRHIRNADRDPVVVDWRAEVARSFYQASQQDSLGLSLRRRFGFDQGHLTGFEDEVFGGPQAGVGSGQLSALVAAEIERPRTGPMRDIVATIEPEQDSLVRADLDDSICVQGGPGTGKTAVGLHRAAYLLYAFDSRLRNSGVLVIGPNAAFIEYINQVLPALGEVHVDQMALQDLLAHVPLRGADREAAAAVKHDARMAEVIRRAVSLQMAAAGDSLAVRVGLTTLRLEPGELEGLRLTALRRGGPYGAGRDRFRGLVVDQLLAQAEHLIGGVERRHVVAALRGEGGAAPQATLEVAWPKQNPVWVIHALLSDPVHLAEASQDLLSSAEQALLGWPGKPRRSAAPWSPADLVLIDEAACAIARPRSYGHVVLDEAQDLSPMQLRAVGRRAQRGLSIFGDLAQGTTPWASSNWPTALHHLGVPGARMEMLSRAFRIPGSVLHLANRLLPAIAPGLPPATAVRDAVTALAVVQAGQGAAAHDVSDPVVAQAVLHSIEALRDPGSLGLVVSVRHRSALEAALTKRRIDWGGVAGIATGQRVTLVAPEEAKGLEFDVVILMEPSAIAPDGGIRALRMLYIAMTRAVRRLVIVHADPLPQALQE